MIAVTFVALLALGAWAVWLEHQLVVLARRLEAATAELAAINRHAERDNIALAARIAREQRALRGVPVAPLRRVLNDAEGRN